VNAVVPEYLSSYEVSLRLDQVDLADIIKAMNLQFRAEAANLGWTAARTRGNRTTYVLEPKPAELTLTSIAAARGPGLTNLLPRLTFRDAPLREVAEHLRKMGCPHPAAPLQPERGGGVAGPAQRLPADIVEMLMRLIGEEVYWECQGLQLSSGQWVFALLLKDQEEAKPVEGLVKVYYGGDDTVELRTTQVMLMDLLVTAGLDKKAQVMVHDPSRMIVVRGPQEVQDFVLNAIEEMRRGREAKRAAGTPRPAGPPPPSAPPAAQP
jgi:hypothetical protein